MDQVLILKNDLLPSLVMNLYNEYFFGFKLFIINEIIPHGHFHLLQFRPISPLVIFKVRLSLQNCLKYKIREKKTNNHINSYFQNIIFTHLIFGKFRICKFGNEYNHVLIDLQALDFYCNPDKYIQPLVVFLWNNLVNKLFNFNWSFIQILIEDSS